MKRAAIIILIVLVAISVTVVFAQAPGRAPGAGRTGGGGTRGLGMGCPAMMLTPPRAAAVDASTTLQLTAEQKTKLKDILTQGDTALTVPRQKLTQASQALRDAVMAPNYSEQKVAQLATEAEKADAAVVTMELRIWTQIRGVVPADQLPALQAGRMGGGGRGFGGPAGGTPPSAPPPGR